MLKLPFKFDFSFQCIVCWSPDIITQIQCKIYTTFWITNLWYRWPLYCCGWVKNWKIMSKKHIKTHIIKHLADVFEVESLLEFQLCGGILLRVEMAIANSQKLLFQHFITFSCLFSYFFLVLRAWWIIFCITFVLLFNFFVSDLFSNSIILCLFTLPWDKNNINPTKKKNWKIEKFTWRRSLLV